MKAQIWNKAFPVFPCFRVRVSLTCVQPLAEFFDLIGGAWFPVNPLCVEAVHLDVVDEFLHQLGHCSLLAGQTGQLHGKLPRRQLRFVLEYKNTNDRNTSHKVSPLYCTVCKFCRDCCNKYSMKINDNYYCSLYRNSYLNCVNTLVC